MSVSIAQMNFNVWLGLAQPDAAILTQADIHLAVRNALSLLTNRARQSDNNQLLSVTNDLTPTDRVFEITDEVEQTTIAWAEIKDGEFWRILRIAPKVMLDQYRREGVRACTFYGLDRDGSVLQYVEFNFDPTSETVRFWFDQDVVPVNLDAIALIPDNLTILVELQAQNQCIVTMKNRLVAATEIEDDKELLNMRLGVLNDAYAHNLTQIASWNAVYQDWKNRSRAAQASRSLPRRSAKGYYG